MRALRLLALSGLAGLSSACAIASDPCGAQHECIGLRIEGARSDIDQFAITIDHPATKTGFSPAQPASKSIRLPAKLPLHLAAGTTGDVHLQVIGLAGGQPVAVGYGATKLDAAGHGQVTISLVDGAPDLGAADLSPCSADLAADDPLNCGACGNVCASGVCGRTITALTGAAPDLWTLNAGSSGGASYDAVDKVVVLTADLAQQLGTMIYKHPLVVDGFTANFDFQMTWDPTQAHGDGMAFILIKNDPTVPNIDTAISHQSGSGLGMVVPQAANSATVLSGYAVEFDTLITTYMNPNGTCGELLNLGEHVNVDTLALCAAAPGAGLPEPVSSPVKVTLADGNVHHAQVALAADGLTLWVDQMLLIHTSDVHFAPGDQYYFGFSAGTGAVSEKHMVSNIAITFPTPRCL